MSISITKFIGAHYEVTDDEVTKYYYAGSQRIAMRKNGEVFYMFGDHLGSTSLTTDAAGQVIAEQRYTAWGETRYDSGESQTKYQYTGQYSYVTDFGLHYYGARWYDSQLGRFAQADTIIPGGAQGMDRYAYANNNAMKYTDPSGHGPCWAGKNYKCNLNAGQLASLLGNKNTEKFAMNYIASNIQSTPCSSTIKDRYCDLNNGGRIDKAHFEKGQIDWNDIEGDWRAWRKNSSANSSTFISTKFGVTVQGVFIGFTHTEEFNFSAITSLEQLKVMATDWYLNYHRNFESHQYTYHEKTRPSAFNSEDIPSAMMGFVGKANEIGYDKVVNMFGGGTVSNDSRYPDEQVDCLASPSVCSGITSPRNMSTRLKAPVPGTPYYNFIDYPRDSYPGTVFNYYLYRH
jgi:RHS repeat-associated protein